MGKPDAASLIQSALDLLARDGSPDGFRSRRAVEALIAAETGENAQKTLDLKRTMIDLFEWAPNAGDQRIATGIVIKAAAQLLVSEDAKWRSRYPHAIEALSFAAATTKLINPDYIGELLRSTVGTRNAYAPIRYPAQLALQLERLIGHYPEKRRLELLKSLWDIAHRNRWWDYTLSEAAQRRGARRRAQQEAEAGEAILQVTTESAIQGILTGDITWSPAMNERLWEAGELDKELRVKISRATQKPRFDADLIVAASYLVGMRPDERPHTPILDLVETLWNSYLDRYEEEGIEGVRDVLPEKPRAWEELYPEAGFAPFNFPKYLREINGIEWENGIMYVCRNAAELAANANYMGNCTNSYRNRSEQGSVAILRYHKNNEAYNAALNLGNTLTYGEINSRFNRGGVSQEVRASFDRFKDHLQQLARRAA